MFHKSRYATLYSFGGGRRLRPAILVAFSGTPSHRGPDSSPLRRPAMGLARIDHAGRNKVAQSLAGQAQT
jgi:hypothetical protein